MNTPKLAGKSKKGTGEIASVKLTDMYDDDKHDAWSSHGVRHILEVFASGGTRVVHTMYGPAQDDSLAKQIAYMYAEKLGVPLEIDNDYWSKLTRDYDAT